QNHDVPVLLTHKFDCLVRGTRFTKGNRAGLFIEHLLDPVSDDSMVIHHKDFRHCSTLFSSLGYAGMSARDLTHIAALHTLIAAMWNAQGYSRTLSPAPGEIDPAPDEVGALSHAQQPERA